MKPIAIVGEGCVLPGALSPEALWELVRHKGSAVAHTKPGLWRIDQGADRAKLAAEIVSETGGYVEGFVFDPTGFSLEPHELDGLDEVFLYTLHAAREAMKSAGLDPREKSPRGTVVLGNLSYPTPGLVDLALEVWKRGGAHEAGTNPKNRYMSGLPAHLVAAALGFHGGAFALDAACASSLYAVKLACDRLNDGLADVAVAGGVNHADDLFLHGGFSALRALSPTGQSRPFHKEADGLVPAQGAAVVVLMRLDDALAQGKNVLGVVRGVGLSNDGRSRGLMVPSEEGQIRAMRAAYADAGLSPSDVSLVECHATGTVVGDGAELRSMREVFAGARDLPIGSIKSNMGHLITASGGAGIIKVLAAMRHRVRPPSIHAELPNDELADGMFRVLHEEEPWPSEGPRRAGISNFGFGGNNAHLVLEEWLGSRDAFGASVPHAPRTDHAVAIVAQTVRTGHTKDATVLHQAFFTTHPPHETSLVAEAPAGDVTIDAVGLRFPPTDLRAALPQQLLVLAAAQDLEDVLARLPHERTSLLVGMQTDAEVARHAIRWCGDREWVGALPHELADVGLSGASVIGCMPNIVANRLSHQLDFRGPSFAISSEEASGNVAFELAVRALRHGEIDAAVVGAVDLSCEPVSRATGREALASGRNVPGDAAVLMVLKRYTDALRDGDPILAVVGTSDDSTGAREGTLEVALTDTDSGLSAKLGHAHAASGLLHLAAAVEACAHRAVPSRAGAMPWLPSSGSRAPGRNARVHVTTLGHGVSDIRIHAADTPSPKPLFLGPAPRFGVFASSTLEGLALALSRREEASSEGAHGERFRVAITAETLADYEARIDHAVTLVHALPADTLPKLATLDEGIHFGHGTFEGELSFVYTGAAGAYPHMGRDLALALPDLVDSFASRAASVREAAGWVYTDDPTFESTPMDKLWGASYLAQLHTELTRKALGLRPTAAIGYCSGETNSLFALDAWDNLDGFRRDVSESRVYDRELCGELLCLRSAWNLDEGTAAEWSTWRIRAKSTDVEAALENEPRVHLVIVNALHDVVIAGDPAGCARVGAAFGRKAQRTPGYDFIMHCQEAREFESRWRALHTRPTKDVPGVRFYTHSTLSSYAPTTQTAADALTGQAMNRVNFPALVERAYADGIRIFIEHGPHAGCTKWISDTLGDREHLAIALDRYGHSSLFQGIECAAKLFAAGVPVKLDTLQKALQRGGNSVGTAASASPAKRSLVLTLPAHPEPVPPASTTPRQSKRTTMSPRINLLAPHAHTTQGTLGDYMAPAPKLAPVMWIPPAHVPEHGTTNGGSYAALEPAPALDHAPPAPLAAANASDFSAIEPAPFAVSDHSAYAPSDPAPMTTPSSPYAPAPLAAPSAIDTLAAHHEQLAELHRAFLRQQVAVQTHFVNVTMAPLAEWAAGTHEPSHQAFAETHAPTHETYAAPVPQYVALAPVPAIAAIAPTAPVAPPARPALAPAPALAPVTPSGSAKPANGVSGTNGSHAKAVVTAAAIAKPAPKAAHAAREGGVTKVPPPRKPTGLSLDRKGLEVLASGKISEIFGPLFAQQDGYARQVRMPEPPLLLADRVLGIEGEPGTMGTGTVWTETDVTDDAFYMHEGRMPAGVMVESGQADLLLISWLGADFENKGDRVYRLLGCELKSHGPLPKAGDTLHYEILVDGHAEQDGIRLFFFHYNCWVNGDLRMSVRSGQAGFFTNEELAGSAGVLWAAETAEPKKDARVDAPAALTHKRSLSADDVSQLIEGRIHDVFGPAFARADTHTRTPVIAGGKMRLLDEVDVLDPTGGPWKRGYLRATLHLTPESWFFAGHFKNDPCMPGTLMLEGGLQAMQLFMTGLGHTLDHDGSRFEPMPEQNYSLRCRGQAIPSSKEVVYEIFVEEVHGGAEPMIYADILGTVDGRKAFHCKRMGLRLVPAWPLDRGRMKVEMPKDDKPVAIVDGFKFDYASLLACAWGRPSEAFGPMYARFDSPRRVARLPGPPYHFMSRVPRVEGPIGGMKVGSVAVIDYDVPVGEWYFRENNAPAMPFAVMLETALQPCGWLASYVGGALASDQNLYFRNLDGTGTQHREIPDDIGTLSVETKLTNISAMDAIVIMSFEVVMRAGTEDIYTLKTVFGFFPGDTMANQAGLPMTDANRAALVEPSDVRVDLTAYPKHYFGSSLCLAKDSMLMIERVTGLWLTGEKSGKAGLGRVRAEKSIAAKQWFFKAHFYQDPVQPGSLGIEAMLQALQVLAIDLDVAKGIQNPRFETQASGVAMSWKYRGQVIPENDTVVVDIEATEIRREGDTVTVIGAGSLWVDGKRIYEAKGLAVRVLPGA